ncbi:MAG: hypothetical protein IPF46_00565 [Saprospiraceae bacterium]|nr:hypothetical protein [Candidatus Vicinibacter affinis]
MPESDILVLGGTNGATGIHPAMNKFKELYDEQKLSVIQSVGYPSFNFSL